MPIAHPQTLPLPLEIGARDTTVAIARDGHHQAAIEEDEFPFELFSEVAELESWRKEINRPIYHVHKWWAQRLGTVFRAIVMGTLLPAGTDVWKSFYRQCRFPESVVFDPFMGSGTTVGEALKLGCRAIGRDINPVACFAVKNALALPAQEDVTREFESIERDVAPQIKYFYRARLPDGRRAQTLYYFWVKTLDCPDCSRVVDLFDSYIFARHAYTKRHPIAQVLCPSCGEVQKTRYDATEVSCRCCGSVFDPSNGPAKRTKAVCPHCKESFHIAKTTCNTGRPPKHRLYAKLVLTEDGKKRYLPVDDFDRNLYDEAAAMLRLRGKGFLRGKLKAGYNTNQAINYGYRNWRDMFNDRQLLCLGFLADRIGSISNEGLRDLFACLFSGTLEFNNMFASFKGEGTGAVRHMFSHHILKPERKPLEANPWGTPKSSGAFSTLFRSRIMRAIEYCENPFEIAIGERNGRVVAEKVFGLSESIGFPIARSYSDFQKGNRVYLSCGDSGHTDLASGSVDAVVTDPPFFDNVHYSELADFFHVWQQHILESAEQRSLTTRSRREVQQTDAEAFTDRLEAVWKECWRVLKLHGLLVFTYHHARPEGWHSIFRALVGAGFLIVAAHPIKSELSVAKPKSLAKDPIDLDIIIVCRKRDNLRVDEISHEMAWQSGLDIARNQIHRLHEAGRQLSRNDIRIILTAQFIRFLSASSDTKLAFDFLARQSAEIELAIDSLAISEMAGY